MSSSSKLPEPLARVGNIRWPHSDSIETQAYASNIIYGFIGLGNMGSGIVRNLLKSHHRVVIWNRSKDKYEEFHRAGAGIAVNPCDVSSFADITFCCLSDANAVKNTFFCPEGIMFGLTKTKSYVEMSGIDEETTNDIANVLQSIDARYLEVRFIGSKKEAEEGQLFLLSSGDKSLFKDCESCFKSISTGQKYFNKFGYATKCHIMLQTARAITLTALTEGLQLADSCGLNRSDMLRVMSSSTLNCDFVKDTFNSVMEENFDPKCSLKNLQKDVDMACDCGMKSDLDMGVISIVNESLKKAIQLGYGDLDCSALSLIGKKMPN